jgi:HlyD family secretion protein
MNFLNKIKLYAFAHKIISAVIIIIIIGAGYLGYQKITSPGGVPRYVLSAVARGTIVSSITDSGQVSALNQVNITPTVSGALTSVRVKPGDKVVRGETLFTIDDTNAQKSVRDAEISLQNANLALQKLQLQNSSANLNTALGQAYDNGFTSVSSTFLDLPGVMTGLNTMFFESTIAKNGQWNVDWYAGQVANTDIDNVKPYEQAFKDAYNAALAAFNTNLSSYQNASRSSDSATIDALIKQTYDTTNLISTAIKNANSYINFVNTSIESVNNHTPPAVIASQQATLNTYTSEINSHLNDLQNSETNIASSANAFPSNDLNTQSAEISITQAQNSLSDAKQNLTYYYITAPFDGIIASVPVITGDNVGSGTTLASIITTKDLAVVTLNEVDVAKVALGEKATLTFDAIPNLTIAGEVSEIDSVGTVSQGVVNYNVKISFDAGNSDGVKPGMSANAAIITNVAQDVLMVPSSAIKTLPAQAGAGGASFVQMFDTPPPAPTDGLLGSISATPPRNQPVQVGISNGTSTEIISGLNEGDEIVTKTIASTAKTPTATATPSILGAAGGGRVGGSVRIP